MADFEATSRSNYFKVKNAEAFKRWADSLGLHYEENDTIQNAFAIFGDRCDHGVWPCTHPDEDEDVDLVDELCEHLVDGCICVLMQAGAEKLRYVSGHAIAFKNTGEYVDVRLDEIYDRARVVFGERPIVAEY